MTFLVKEPVNEIAYHLPNILENRWAVFILAYQHLNTIQRSTFCDFEKFRFLLLKFNLIKDFLLKVKEVLLGGSPDVVRGVPEVVESGKQRQRHIMRL